MILPFVFGDMLSWMLRLSFFLELDVLPLVSFDVWLLFFFGCCLRRVVFVLLEPW